MVYWHEIFKSGDSRIPFSRKGYTRYMHKHFEDKYSLYRLISLNFLREEMPEEYEKLTEDSYFNIKSIIEGLSLLRANNCNEDDEDEEDEDDEDEEDEDDILLKKYYKYDKKCRRYIKKVFDLYLPDRVNVRNLKFNCLDYCFLAFLLENMDTKNGQALIRKKVISDRSKKIKVNELILLDSYFSNIVRYGLISLVNYRFNYKPVVASKCILEIQEFFNTTYLVTANINVGKKIQELKDIFEIIDNQNIEISGNECNYIIESLDDIYNILKNVLNSRNK